MSRWWCCTTAGCEIAKSSPADDPGAWSTSNDVAIWTPPADTRDDWLASWYAEFDTTSAITEAALNLFLQSSNDEIPFKLRVFRDGNLALFAINSATIGFLQPRPITTHLRIGLSRHGTKTRIAAVWYGSDGKPAGRITIPLADSITPLFRLNNVSIRKPLNNINYAAVGRLLASDRPCCEPLPEDCPDSAAESVQITDNYQYASGRNLPTTLSFEIDTDSLDTAYAEIDYCISRCSDPDGYYSLVVELTPGSSKATLYWNNCGHSGGRTVVAQTSLPSVVEQSGRYNTTVCIWTDVTDSDQPYLGVGLRSGVGRVMLPDTFFSMANCLTSSTFIEDVFEGDNPRQQLQRLATAELLTYFDPEADAHVSDLQIGCSCLHGYEEAVPAGCSGYNTPQEPGVKITGQINALPDLSVYGSVIPTSLAAGMGLPKGGDGTEGQDWPEDVLNDAGLTETYFESRHPDNEGPEFAYLCLAAAGIRAHPYQLPEAIYQRFKLAQIALDWQNNPLYLWREWAIYSATEWRMPDSSQHNAEEDKQTWIFLRLRFEFPLEPPNTTYVSRQLWLAAQVPYPWLRPDDIRRLPPVAERIVHFEGPESIISGWDDFGWDHYWLSDRFDATLKLTPYTL